MATEKGFDREIRSSVIAWIGVSLVVLGIVASGGMLVLFKYLDAAAMKRDPATSPLPEAALPLPSPSPTLLQFPERELAAFRIEQQTALSTYAWVDAENGIARVPIDSALDWVATHGLPTFPEVATEDSSSE